MNCVNFESSKRGLQIIENYFKITYQRSFFDRKNLTTGFIYFFLLSKLYICGN